MPLKITNSKIGSVIKTTGGIEVNENKERFDKGTVDANIKLEDSTLNRTTLGDATIDVGGDGIGVSDSWPENFDLEQAVLEILQHVTTDQLSTILQNGWKLQQILDRIRPQHDKPKVIKTLIQSMIKKTPGNK